MLRRLRRVGCGGQSHLDDGLLAYREAFTSREYMNGCVFEVVDCDARNVRTPKILTDPVAMVSIEDHAGRPINEDGFCTKPFRAVRETEEIASLPFFQCLMGFKERNIDPLDLVLRCHSPILPASTAV